MIHFEEMEFIRPEKLQSFTKHTLVSGKSGSGKSNTAEFILTQKAGKSKVIDLVDKGRFENCLYSFPETNPFLVKKIEEYSNYSLKPKSFDNEIIFIAGMRLKFIKKLPANIKVMSLDIDDLSLSDMFFLATTQSTKGVLSYLQYEHGNMKINELVDFLQKTEDKVIPTLTKYLLLRNIRKWLNSGMFSENFEKIEFKKILKDKNTITSFNSYLLEDAEEESLFYGLVLKKILDTKRYEKIKHRVTIYCREISNFMGQYAKEYDFVRKQILTIIREGRDIGLDLFADTQRMKDLPTVFRRQMGRIIQLKSDFSDAETLKEIIDVPPSVLYRIPHLKVGEGMVISGSNYYYPCFFLPSLHYHKKPGLDVLKILGRRFGWSKYSSNLLESNNNDPEIKQPKIPIEEFTKNPSQEILSIIGDRIG